MPYTRTALDVLQANQDNFRQHTTRRQFMSNTHAGAEPLHHHSRRMGGRDPHEAHRVATPLELLFDLTFVTAFGFAAAQLAHALAEGHYSVGLLGFSLASFAICWAWVNFSWFSSAYDIDDAHVRLDRARRASRQLGDGAGLCHHAPCHGVPVAARGKTGSRPATRLHHLRHSDLNRAGRLGDADRSRLLRRDEPLACLHPRPHRTGWPLPRRA